MSAIAWKTDSEGTVIGLGLHDGYFYGALQKDDHLIIYVENNEGHQRKIELTGLTEMNITDFWIGSIIGNVYISPLGKVENIMWKKLFAGRIASHDQDDSLRKLIETTKGRYFFSLEATYGANVYAVCDGVKIGDDRSGEERLSQKDQ